MYVDGKVVKALESLITNAAAATPVDPWCIAGYVANGFSDANWLTVEERVRLANGGSQVYAIGTKLALQNVLPVSTDTRFRYDEKSAIVQNGYLPAYKNVPLMEVDNFLQPNTVNGTPAVMGSNKIIYMLPAAAEKPVKVVLEGGTVSVSKDPSQMADHTYTMNIQLMIGVDVICGAKIGAIVLP